MWTPWGTAFTQRESSKSTGRRQDDSPRQGPRRPGVVEAWQARMKEAGDEEAGLTCSV